MNYENVVNLPFTTDNKIVHWVSKTAQQSLGVQPVEEVSSERVAATAHRQPFYIRPLSILAPLIDACVPVLHPHTNTHTHTQGERQFFLPVKQPVDAIRIRYFVDVVGFRRHGG